MLSVLQCKKQNVCGGKQSVQYKDDPYATVAGNFVQIILSPFCFF